MDLPRRLERPDFEGEMRRVWCDPDPLPMPLKVALWALLPRRMTHDQKVHFLYRVGESTQTAEFFKNDTAPADQVAQMGRVQERARALLQSLAALSRESRGTLKAHAEFLAIGTDPPARLSPVARDVVLCPGATLPGHWWDQVQDLETAAAYAALQVMPKKTTRPKQTNSRRLVFMAATDFYRVMGRLPPGSKGAWFPVFAHVLGQALGLEIGPALVDSTVQEMAKAGTFWVTSDVATPPERMHVFFAAPGKPPD